VCKSLVTSGAEHFRKRLARSNMSSVAPHLSALSPKTDTPRRETTCPLWVMCGQCLGKNFTPKADMDRQFWNVSKGHKRTFWPSIAMSALPPKADMCGAQAYVRFGPIADIVLGFGSRQSYSMISSAIESTPDGTVSPSVFAVFRLSTSSNFVDWLTGTSAGFSPLRIRPV
jgi:hypothetical protein